MCRRRSEQRSLSKKSLEVFRYFALRSAIDFRSAIRGKRRSFFNDLEDHEVRLKSCVVGI